MTDKTEISFLPFDFEGDFLVDKFCNIIANFQEEGRYAPRFTDDIIYAEFILKACNSYHDNKKLVDDQAEIIAAQNELIAEQAERIVELEGFVKEITTYKTTDRIKEDINFMLDSGRSCPTFEQTLEAIYKSIKSKAKQLLGSE